MVGEDALRSQFAGTAGDAAARVGARTALVVPLDGGAVLVPARRRAEEIHLWGQELAGEDIAFRQADHSFDVERSHHLTLQDQLRETGEELLEGVLHRVAETVAFGVPLSAARAL